LFYLMRKDGFVESGVLNRLGIAGVVPNPKLSKSQIVLIPDTTNRKTTSFIVAVPAHTAVDVIQDAVP